MADLYATLTIVDLHRQRRRISQLKWAISGHTFSHYTVRPDFLMELIAISAKSLADSAMSSGAAGINAVAILSRLNICSFLMLFPRCA